MPHVWLAMDPDTSRIAMQDTEFADGAFPRGPRGLDWPIREGDVSDEDWQGILAGTLSGDEVNTIHRTAWSESGDSPWPNP